MPYYRALAALNLPLLLHGGYEHTIPVEDQRFGDPTRFRLSLENGVTLIVAHAGSAGRFHRRETFGHFLQLLETYDNCFGDTAALGNFWRSQYVAQLQDPELLERKYGVVLPAPFERLLHGSDYPIPLSPPAFGFKVARRLRADRGTRGNQLQSDVVLKRLVGIPDSCLTLTSEVLDIC